MTVTEMCAYVDSLTPNVPTGGWVVRGIRADRTIPEGWYEWLRQKIVFSKLGRYHRPIGEWAGATIIPIRDQDSDEGKVTVFELTYARRMSEVLETVRYLGETDPANLTQFAAKEVTDGMDR